MEKTSSHIWVMDVLDSVCWAQRQATVVSPKPGVLCSMNNRKWQNLANTVPTHSEMTESDEQRKIHTTPLNNCNNSNLYDLTVGMILFNLWWAKFGHFHPYSTSKLTASRHKSLIFSLLRGKLNFVSVFKKKNRFLTFNSFSLWPFLKLHINHKV